MTRSPMDDDLNEQGRRLASRREDLIAQGVDPADLLIPSAPLVDPSEADHLVLDDINPRRLISANRRIHHMVRAEVCAYWRSFAHDAAVDAYGHADKGEYWHQRIRIVLHVRFPDKRRRDVGNLYPYVAKPIVDGLVDARLISDDDDYHVTGPDLRRDLERGPARIVIEITDLAERVA